MATPAPIEPRRKIYLKRFPKEAVDLRFSVLKSNRVVARGRCTRINENGFGALVAGELTVGESVAVEFLLMPGNVPIRLMANVRSRQGFLHVFDFIAPNEAQRRMIAEFWSEQLDNTR